MNKSIEFLYIVSITVLFIVSLISSFKKQTINTFAELSLTILNWVYFLAAAIGYLNFSGQITYLPHFIRTGQIFMLMYMPLSFIYIRHYLFPQQYKWYYLLHLIPVLIYIVDYFPFFLKSGSEKIALYKNWDLVELNVGFNEGFFMPHGWHVYLRYLLMAGYWAAQFWLIYKTVRVAGSRFKKDNQTRLNWLLCLMVSQFLIIFPPVITMLMGGAGTTAFLLQITGLLAACIQVYFLFSHPEILYGIRGFIAEPEKSQFEATAETEPEIEPVKLSLDTVKPPIQYVPEEVLDSISKVLQDYMEQKKPFLKKGFGLADMANDTHFTVHQLSGFINKRCEMNFYSFVNRFRIDYCKELLLSHAHLSKTLEAIANESGFQSRATFLRYFKKFTGHTPSEYIKELETISGEQQSVR